MSIKVMSQIWDNGPADMGERFVLLAIADHANDDGVAYPSAARIARKTCMDERSVRRISKRLSDAGWLRVNFSAGPRGCNVFTIQMPDQTPDLKSGVTVGQGDRGSATPDLKSGDPLTDGQPNHHLTIKEPSEASQASPAPSPLGKRLPEDWKPNEELTAYAIEQGIDHGQINRIIDDFKDYWIAKPGKDGRKTDWGRTWQRWIRTEADNLPSGNGRGPRLGEDSAIEQAKDAATRAVERYVR